MIDNTFSDNISAELANLVNVRIIRLDGNSFTGIVPAELCVLYSEIKPLSYADCDKLAFAVCFLWCCVDSSEDCVCRLQDTPDFFAVFWPWCQDEVNHDKTQGIIPPQGLSQRYMESG